MQREDVRYGQRIRVNVPGVGDHGYVGIVKRVRGDICSVHMDRDQRPRHLIVFFAGDLDLVAAEPPLDVGVIGPTVGGSDSDMVTASSVTQP